jgi:hypothetical protein
VPDPVVVPPRSTPTACPLLVVVRDADDIGGPLREARGRAAAEGRVLLVALVVPPLPLSTHPVVHALYTSAVKDLAAAAAMAGRGDHRRLSVTVVPVRAPRRPTRPGARRALRRRLDEVARRYGAERHPDPPADRPGTPPGAAVSAARR